MNNNPLRYTDPSGHWIETALDIVFIFFDLQQISQEGWTPVNTLALVADVTCAIIPFGTGGGPGVRLAFAGANATIDVTRAASGISDAVRIGQVVEKGIQFFDGLYVATVNPESNGPFTKIGSSGKIGEEYLNNNFIGQSQVPFKTSSGEKRVVDLFTNKGFAFESKVGRTNLTGRVSTQVLRDSKLLGENAFQGVEWFFFKSPVTGKVGPSSPLFNFLLDHNITIHIIE